MPLGVVVADEADGWVAIEAGADETILESALSQPTALAFVDRVLLRARLRREQEQLSATYVHSEKLVALGTLVAGVAHEVNNPLTSLLLSAEGLKLRVSPLCNAMTAIEKLAFKRQPVTHEEILQVLQIGRTGARMTETRELLSEIEASAQTIARVVRDLKLFARPDDEAVPEVLEIRPLLDQVLRLVGRQIRNHALVEIDYDQELPPIVAPSSRLAQVFTNILLNAAHAVTEIDRPTHRIRISAQADEEAVAVSISDTGPGIAPGVVSRIFDPFFTTKRQGVGTGLGLSISRSILRRLGGDLLVESVHGDGATFIALIPRPDRRALYEAHRHSSVTSQVRPCATPRQRILIVDSDEHVLRAVARAIDSQFDVLLARDGQEAIELLSSGSRVDVVIADASQPELSGIVLTDWLRSEGNRLLEKTIFMTPEDTSPHDVLAQAGFVLLRKPVSRNALMTALTDIVNLDKSAIA
jgi:signal transduction histidine kinase